MITIKIQISRIIYKKESADRKIGAWYILAAEQGKCTGVINWEVVEGERLELSGEWAVYKGEKNFKFSSVRPDIPCDSQTMLHYVCERTHGIGTKKEKLIWETLKEDWTEIEVGDVPGLPDTVVNEFLKQYREILLHDEQYKTIAYLIGRGCTPRMAELSWETWESQAIGIINNNCFRLTELPGYGFCHVDGDIRQEYKIADTDPRRIKAGIIYAINQAQSDGSTVTNTDDMLTQAENLLKLDTDIILNATAEMLENELVMFNSGKLATAFNFNNEAVIWNFGGTQCN